jgi:O-antigen/teichoic acid export membrane protein
MNSQSTAKTRFGRDVLIAGAANLIKSLRNLILVPLIAGKLSLAHFGEWELLAAGIALALPWITGGLGSALVRFLAGQERDEIKEGVFSILLGVLCSSSAAGFILWSAAGLVDHFPSLSPLYNHRMPIALLLVASSLLGITRSYFRAMRQMVRHSVLSLVQHFGEVLFITLCLLAGLPLHSALWAIIAVRSLLLLCTLVAVVHDLGIGRPKLHLLKTYLYFSIPLIPNSLFYRLYDSADKLFLFVLLGPTAVGAYSAAYLAGSLFTTIVSPIHTVLFPAIASLWNQDQKQEIGEYLSQTVRYSALLALPALAGAAVLAHPLLSLLIQADPEPLLVHYLLLSVSFVIFGFGIPCGDLLATAGRARWLFSINGGLAVTNIALNALLIPQIGVTGAVLSTLLCHTSYSVATLVLARRLVHFSMPWSSIVRSGLASLLTAAAVRSLFGHHPEQLVLPIIAGVCCYAPLIFLLGGLSSRDVRFAASLLGIKR